LEIAMRPRHFKITVRPLFGSEADTAAQNAREARTVPTEEGPIIIIGEDGEAARFFEAVDPTDLGPLRDRIIELTQRKLAMLEEMVAECEATR
jgi:hypothetical protein